MCTAKLIPGDLVSKKHTFSRTHVALWSDVGYTDSIDEIGSFSNDDVAIVLKIVSSWRHYKNDYETEVKVITSSGDIGWVFTEHIERIR